jgi:hypothetical protein
VALDYMDADPAHSMLWHATQLYPLGVARVLQAVEDLGAGRAVPGRPQPAAGHGYYGFPTAAEIEAFRIAGNRLYDLREYRDLLRRFVPAHGAQEALPVVEQALNQAASAHARTLLRAPIRERKNAGR